MLALTSSTSGGRSVGIVRWRTKGPELPNCTLNYKLLFIWPRDLSILELILLCYSSIQAI
jgi:hypothetical protein